MKLRIRSLLVATAFAAAVTLTSCTWYSAPGNKAKVAETGQWLLGKATNIALSAVVGAAQSQADASVKADWLDSFAAGVRSKATASFSGADLATLTGIWTPAKPHWQALATGLAPIVDSFTGVSPLTRNELIAQAVQTAAAVARAKPASAFTKPPEPRLLDSVLTVDLRRERIVDPPSPAQGPLIVTRLNP